MQVETAKQRNYRRAPACENCVHHYTAMYGGEDKRRGMLCDIDDQHIFAKNICDSYED